MKKAFKVFVITLLVVLIIGMSGYLFYKNMQLNKSYEVATTQVSDLQAKLDAVGTFTDVYTIKVPVKMGQEIKEEDLTLQTIPTSAVPVNSITDKGSLLGSYYRIGLNPGVTLTTDFVIKEEYIGSVYERDLFIDSLPVGLVVGDYIDVRIVLPGGDELVVFPHKRVNSRFENAIKMYFDESDLWKYTSMMVDRSLYKTAGLKIYATKYKDPGAHDKTLAYYPVRREVVDLMNVNGNLTDTQRASMWNDKLRTAIDAKLKFYDDPLNTESSKIAGGWSEEAGRVAEAKGYYDELIRDIESNTPAGGLQDPTSPPSEDTPIGDLGGDSTNNGGATVDGLKDGDGNGSVIGSQDYLDNLGDSLQGDETIIE